MEIRSEMHKIVQSRIEAGLATSLHQIVHGVMDARPALNGGDAAFYRVHTYADLARIAKRVIGKYAANDSTASELLLPGFTHLCKAYPMMRDGEPVIVPVDQCTDDELAGRAAQLDEMALGCTAHAKEIRGYLKARATASKVAA